MTVRRLVSSRYGVTWSRVEHIEMSNTHRIHKQINLRECRIQKYESSDRFINNTIEQSIQHEQLMLNRNLR
jgi:hypothetical protein